MDESRDIKFTSIEKLLEAGKEMEDRQRHGELL